MLERLPLWIGFLLCTGWCGAESLSLQGSTEQVSLVELYTSEGCSSCPPADRWLAKLVDDPRLWRELVPVAFHVDYWDYLGWPDRFADPRYSRRQQHYAAVDALSTVYTPGLVVNGAEWRGWFRGEPLALTTPVPVGRLSLELAGERLNAHFSPLRETTPDLELHVALLGFELTTAVARGENRGRELRHDFVVLGYRRLPLHWRDDAYRGSGRLPQPSAPSPRQAIAAWVSARDDPRPIQAVGGWR